MRTAAFIRKDDVPAGKIELHQILRLVKYLKPYKLLIVSLLLSVISTFLTLLPPRLIGLIVDEAIAKKQLSTLHLLIFLLLGAYVLSHLLGGLRGFIMGNMGQRVIYSMWQDVYRNLQRLSFSFYDSAKTGDIMSRITNDVTAVESIIIESVPETILSFITLAGIVFFSLSYKLAACPAGVYTDPRSYNLGLVLFLNSPKDFQEGKEETGRS